MQGGRRATAVLVVRLWAEGDEPADIRALVRSTLDVLDVPTERRAVAGRQQLLDAVAAWVDRFVEVNRAGPGL